MSEPPTVDPKLEYSDDFSEDRTQPTAEIINALNSPTKSEPPEVPTPTELDSLTAQLRDKPHDPDGWKRLVELAESSGDIEKIRATYDALLKQYPNTVGYFDFLRSFVYLTCFQSSAQIAYISHFLTNQNTFGEAEELFKKFLRTSPSVDLWKFYLTYVR
jgi:cleavage stimulation factor subunit 3